jgi:hypothetical protein
MLRHAPFKVSNFLQKTTAALTGPLFSVSCKCVCARTFPRNTRAQLFGLDYSARRPKAEASAPQAGLLDEAMARMRRRREMGVRPGVAATNMLLQGLCRADRIRVSSLPTRAHASPRACAHAHARMYTISHVHSRATFLRRDVAAMVLRWRQVWGAGC